MPGATRPSDSFRGKKRGKILRTMSYLTIGRLEPGSPRQFPDLNKTIFLLESVALVGGSHYNARASNLRGFTNDQYQ